MLFIISLSFVILSVVTWRVSATYYESVKMIQCWVDVTLDNIYENNYNFSREVRAANLICTRILSKSMTQAASNYLITFFAIVINITLLVWHYTSVNIDDAFVYTIVAINSYLFFVIPMSKNGMISLYSIRLGTEALRMAAKIELEDRESGDDLSRIELSEFKKEFNTSLRNSQITSNGSVTFNDITENLEQDNNNNDKK